MNGTSLNTTEAGVFLGPVQKFDDRRTTFDDSHQYQLFVATDMGEIKPIVGRHVVWDKRGKQMVQFIDEGGKTQEVRVTRVKQYQDLGLDPYLEAEKKQAEEIKALQQLERERKRDEEEKQRLENEAQHKKSTESNAKLQEQLKAKKEMNWLKAKEENEARNRALYEARRNESLAREEKFARLVAPYQNRAILIAEFTPITEETQFFSKHSYQIIRSVSNAPKIGKYHTQEASRDEVKTEYFKEVQVHPEDGTKVICTGLDGAPYTYLRSILIAYKNLGIL